MRQTNCSPCLTPGQTHFLTRLLRFHSVEAGRGKESSRMRRMASPIGMPLIFAVTAMGDLFSRREKMIVQESCSSLMECRSIHSEIVWASSILRAKKCRLVSSEKYRAVVLAQARGSTLRRYSAFSGSSRRAAGAAEEGRCLTMIG